MGSKIFSFAALIVGGIIVADILTHPQGVQAASSGLSTLWGQSVNGLLGGTSTSGAKGGITRTKQA